MARKTQQEVNFWFQDNTVKSALDLTLIEKKLHNNGLDIPNNVIIHKNGSTYEDFVQWYYSVIKISKYPTTYEECVRIAKNIHGYDIHIDAPAYITIMESFVKLLICRDAYWKIAGDAMGLGKPWEPEWQTNKWDYETQKFCIFVSKNEIELGYIFNENKILAFPTEEMRDVFCDNFKDLIESCKTLL